MKRKKKLCRNFQVPQKSLIVVNATATLEGCDEQLLPASYRAFEVDLHFHPSKLGQIYLAQALGQSLLCPLWGYISDRHSRKWLLASGCCVWGIFTILMSIVTEFWQVVLLRCFTGAFLGSLGPVSQSVVIDSCSEKNYGLAFGWIYFFMYMGRLVGGVVTTSVSFHMAGKLRGWRVCYICVGIVSLIFGLMIALILKEIPRRCTGSKDIEVVNFTSDVDNDDKTLLNCDTNTSEMKNENKDVEYGSNRVIDMTCEIDTRETPLEMIQQTENVKREDRSLSKSQNLKETKRTKKIRRYKKMRNYCGSLFRESLRTPTTFIIILESFFCAIRIAAFSFNTLYFQYCGMTDFEASLITCASLVSGGIMAILGGMIGDYLHRIAPSHGRPFLGQFAALARLPLIVLWYDGLPRTREYFYSHLVISILVGITAVNLVSVNRPILADVVSQKYKGTIFSITHAVEGTSASLLGAPLVGTLAEQVFGFTRTSLPVSRMPEKLREGNANALGKSLVSLSAASLLISFFLFGLLHFTYKSDMRNKYMRELEEMPSQKESNIDEITNVASPRHSIGNEDVTDSRI